MKFWLEFLLCCSRRFLSWYCLSSDSSFLSLVWYSCTTDFLFSSNSLIYPWYLFSMFTSISLTFCWCSDWSLFLASLSLARVNSKFFLTSWRSALACSFCCFKKSNFPSHNTLSLSRPDWSSCFSVSRVLICFLRSSIFSVEDFLFSD